MYEWLPTTLYGASESSSITLTGYTDTRLLEFTRSSPMSVTDIVTRLPTVLMEYCST